MSGMTWMSGKTWMSGMSGIRSEKTIEKANRTACGRMWFDMLRPQAVFLNMIDLYQLFVNVKRLSCSKLRLI